MEKEQPSFYAIIPANVRYDKNICPNAKLLYGEITALTNAKGFCWAGNAYFADLYQVSNKTVSRWFTELENAGYIKRELIYKEGTKEIDKRYTRINAYPMDKKVEGYGQKEVHPMDKIAEDNNTLINNTININNKTLVQDELERDFQEFYSHYPIKKGKANAVKAYNKARKKKYSHETIMNGLMSYKQELQMKGTDKQFIKQPATFLNGEHFNDEYDLTVTMNNNKKMSRMEELAYGITTGSENTGYGQSSVPKQIELL